MNKFAWRGAGINLPGLRRPATTNSKGRGWAAPF